ncbi:MAG: hypothetical protein PHR81_11540 [Bacteroidales bacterium]|jgi:hypothetical protein|nr:hypothetical protein [Bacteroidales bacterium]MDD4215431.1 hypothetical protein [Bacteroidales bacterium]
MDDLSELISGIEYKTHQLIKQLEKVKNENHELKIKLDILTKKQEENTKSIKFLEEKNKVLLIVKSIEGEENKTKAKLKINELLREVERCIALLNK